MEKNISPKSNLNTTNDFNCFEMPFAHTSSILSQANVVATKKKESEKCTVEHAGGRY